MKPKTSLKTIKIILQSLLLLMVVVATKSCNAQVSGATAMNFLKIATDVRAIGMGEAGTALSDDIGTLFWNPAGLANITYGEAQFMYNKWFQDISSQYAAFAIPCRRTVESGRVKNYGTFAASINYLTVAPFQGYDANSNMTGKVDASDMALGLGYGFHVTPALSFGMNLKYLSETLAGVTATAYAADAGLLYKSLSGFGLGVSAQNIGTAVKFINEEGALPMTLRAGMSYQKDVLSQPLTLALDAVKPNDRDAYFGTGIEYWVKDMLALRTGYRTGIDEGNGLRVGIGLKTNLFQVDYAFAGFGELGLTHRVGLSVRFGQGVRMNRTASLFERGKQYYEEGRYSLAIIELNKVVTLEPENKDALNLMRLSYKKLDELSKKNAM